MLPLRCVWQCYFSPSLTVLWELLRDGLQFLSVAARSRTAVAAEVLFLRKQLAYYRDHQIRPRRLTDAARLSLVLWSRLFDWKEALMVVTPGTFVRWHREGFKRYWRWKSRGGRPALPKDLRQLIARMVRENITWGEERVADELSLKLGILVSPRTVRKYWPLQPDGTGRRRTSSQHFCGEACNAGPGTITKGVHTPVWGQGFLSRRRTDRDDYQRRTGTDCHGIARSE